MPGDKAKNEPNERAADPGSFNLQADGQGDVHDILPISITDDLTAAMHSGFGIDSPFTRDIPLGRQAIVGMRFQGGSDELVQDQEPGSRISFLRETENRFDPDAVMALDEKGRKLGYIPRHENRIPGALLDAGKSLYGIVTEIAEGRHYAGGRTPAVMYVDLYMREFAPPGGLTQIPRQGSSGSYAVLYLETDEGAAGGDAGSGGIRSVFAIKVINGEERGIFSDSISRNSMQEPMIRGLQSFIGYLPIVSHGITGETQKILEESWGVYTGRAFSNQVIDIREMAKHHLNELRALSIEDLADRLGIEIRCDAPREARCRQIWRIYCRFDRSELKRKQDIISGKQSGNPEV